jgi:hypothetical protein
MEGSGSGSVQINYGSGCGSRRLKHIRIQMRTRKTGLESCDHYLFVKVIIKRDLPWVGASVRDPGHAFTQQAAVLLLVLSNKVKHGL